MLTAIPIAPQRGSVPGVASLDYATSTPTKPPFDWPAAARQAAFAIGVAGVLFGVTYQWSNLEDRTAPIAAALGGLLAALAVPWPGRFGRRR